MLISLVTKSNFITHYVIGKGGFGRVWRVENKRGKEEFAMKEMSKQRVVAKKSI